MAPRLLFGEYQNFAGIWFLLLQNIQELWSIVQYVTDRNQIDIIYADS
jgi:hypothetical protein